MAEQIVNLTIVKEVKKHPYLYNNKLGEYSRKDLSEKAWNDIGQKLNMSATECRQKWHNIRTVFIRHLKTKQIQRPYYLADELKFLVPFIKYRKRDGTAEKPMETQTQVIKEEEDCYVEEDSITLSDICEIDPDIPMDPLYRLQSDSFTCPSPQPLSTNSSPNLQRKKRKLEFSIINEDLHKKDNLENTDGQQEANKMFLLSLLPDMNAMSPSQIRKFKITVIEAISGILDAPKG